MLRPSARHADILLATGPVNKQTKERLKRVFNQMADKKFVVAIGSCAIAGGPFQNLYNIGKGIDEVIPVDIYVPGCPPRPEAIINALLMALKAIK
jgi:NADH:ubiquinone oxidoreductase subunit B-like Fe-S oxidoreductase